MLPSSTTPPSFLLIRVQDDLYGAVPNAQGLHLPYVREGEHGAFRNTSHWSVNALVSDHAYGSFNQAADGSLKGSVVIVADPREMPVPAGLGQVDTWFRMNATPGSDGALQRGLNVGQRAVVVVPEGLDVPDGVNVVRYDGTLAGRDAAVQGVVRDQGVTMEQAGMWGWAGSGQRASQVWAENVVAQHYPEHAARIHLGSHASSPDEALENGAQIEGMLALLATERLQTRSDGVEEPWVDVVRRAVIDQKMAIQTLVGTMPPNERQRVGAYYDGRMTSMETVEPRLTVLEAMWQARMNADADPSPAPGMTDHHGLTLPPPLFDAMAPGMLPPPLPPPLDDQPLVAPPPWAPVRPLDLTTLNRWCPHQGHTPPPLLVEPTVGQRAKPPKL